MISCVRPVFILSYRLTALLTPSLASAHSALVKPTPLLPLARFFHFRLSASFLPTFLLVVHLFYVLQLTHYSNSFLPNTQLMHGNAILLRVILRVDIAQANVRSLQGGLDSWIANLSRERESREECCFTIDTTNEVPK